MNLFYTNETNTLKNHKEKVGDIMTSLKRANRRVGSLFAVAALLLATITPGLVPAFASAAQVTERSVALSTFSKGADNVTYTVNFTAAQAAGAFVVEFCSNSPLIEASCTIPTGLSVVGPSTSTGTWTVQETTDAPGNALVATDPISASEVVSVAIAGIDNPDNAGTVYARIVTYDTEANALAYVSNNLGTGNVDEGGAAFSITDTVGVSGAVLESMTFCVAANLITNGNCTNASSFGTPTLELGEGTGDVKALSSTATSTGSIYAQLSTNAAGGAVVNLKSSTTGCGGLVRVGPTNCDITPSGDGIAPGDAEFGAQIADATDPSSGASPSGNLRPAGDSPFYSDSIFKLNYVGGDASGITGPYGDPFFDSDDLPVSDKNVQITFGARVTNQTPAGLYSADLSLIATGKF